MKVIIMSTVLIFVSLFLLEPIMDSTAEPFEYIEYTQNDTYTAVEDNLTTEDYYLTYSYDSLNYVSVNGVNLDIDEEFNVDIFFVWSTEDMLQFVQDSSTTGDAVIINYNYLVYESVDNMGTTSRTLLEIIPLVLVLGLLSSIVYVMITNKK